MEDIKDTQTEVENAQLDQEEKKESVEAEREEKLFTQEQVDEILKSRLAREKARTNKLIYGDAFSAELLEREKIIELREMKADAKESLSDLNIPNEFIELVNFSNRKSMEKSLQVIENINHTFESIINERVTKEIEKRIAGRTPKTSTTSSIDNTAKAFRHPNL